MRARQLLLMISGLLLLGPQSAYAGSLPGAWHKGANLINARVDQYSSPESDEAIAALRDTGSTHAALVPTWRMATATSSALVPGHTTPSTASLRHAIATARSQGLSVTLKPHVDVDDGKWRGEIAPACRRCWWSSYRSMLLAYATLARQTGVDLLVVGTELESMEGDTTQWRSLIGAVRRRFPGRLTYAANNIPRRVAFWDALDAIGSDFWLPLVEEEANPTVERLVAAWEERGYVRAFAALSARWRRPVVLTEIGYRSIGWASRLPWEFATRAPGLQEPQERAYEAAYRVLSRQRWLRGLYWWDWQPWGDAGDDAFSARAKLAELVMRRWNRPGRLAASRGFAVALPSPRRGRLDQSPSTHAHPDRGSRPGAPASG